MNIKKLRACMVLSGLTQGEVAKKMGMSNATLSAKINGHSHVTLRDIKAMMDALNLTAEEAVEIFLTDIPENGN